MKNKSKKTTTHDYYLFTIRIIGDFGASIAVPVIMFVLIGQYLDERFSKSPIFTIIGFILAAAISAKIIHKKAKRYGREYQKLVDNENIDSEINSTRLSDRQE